MAIFLGMLPKEYQDLIMQQSVMLKDVSYEHWRDHIINVVNQKQQMRKPTDMELGNVDAFGWYGSGFDDPEDWWEIEAIRGQFKGKGKGKGCWNCGAPDHLQRDCPEPPRKGTGKGKGVYNPKGFGKGG